MKHPIQSTVLRGSKLRFVSNDVITLMMDTLKKEGVDLNTLHELGAECSQEDWDQFNQLIGYSVSAAPIDSAIQQAALLAHNEGKSILVARAENAEASLLSVRRLLCSGIAELYEKHPNDLMEEVSVVEEPTNDERPEALKNASPENIVATMTAEQQIEFNTLIRPLVKFLCDNYHPHVAVIVTPTDARLMEGVYATSQIREYLRD